MDTTNGTGGICPPYLDTHGPETWGAPRWGGSRPEINGPRAAAIREKRTWEARGELATFATEAEFAADIAGELVPMARLLRVLGERAFELNAKARLVARCLATADVARRRRTQDGFRAPLPLLAARCELSVRHVARLVEHVVAALRASGVGVAVLPDFVRRKAACSRRGNAYTLDWPPRIAGATPTKNVRASGTETSAKAPDSAPSPPSGGGGSTTTTPAENAQAPMRGQGVSAAPTSYVVPAAVAAASAPVVPPETRSAGRTARRGEVTSYRDALVAELATATGDAREFLEERIAAYDLDELRRRTYARKP